MESNPLTAPKPISDAKLRANRANAKLSTGPSKEGQKRSRLNALKHGLAAQVPLLSQDLPRIQRFVDLAWARLAPRNPLEEVCVKHLLLTRLWEDAFIEVERTVLTRKPLLTAPDDERSFPFLNDPKALQALEHLVRHLAHFTLATEKELLELLRLRQEGWEVSREHGSQPPAIEDLLGAEPRALSAGVPPCQPDPGGRQFYPGSREDCLSEKRLILPGEDVQDYEALVDELWATFRPRNTLAGFTASDFI